MSPPPPQVRALKQELSAKEFVVTDLRKQVSELLQHQQDAIALRTQLASLDERVRKGQLGEKLGLSEEEVERIDEVVDREAQKGTLQLSLGDFSRLANDVAAWHAANLRGALPTMWKIDGAFKRFDSDGSGRIELKELTGARKALGLETDEAGAKAVLGRYERKEMHAGLDLAEFTQYVEHMSKWMRTELHFNSNQLEMFLSLIHI